MARCFPVRAQCEFDISGEGRFPERIETLPGHDYLCWSSVGNLAQGRATIPKLNYRNTLEVLSVGRAFATDLLSGRGRGWGTACLLSSAKAPAAAVLPRTHSLCRPLAEMGLPRHPHTRRTGQAAR